MKITKYPTPNYNSGRLNYRPEAIVLHIAEGTYLGTIDWFGRNESRVSSHYLIGSNGEIAQFVGESDTAWHAGGVARPTWSLLKNNINPNLYTIGIEFAGVNNKSISELAYNSAAELVKDISARWNIPLDSKHLVYHSEINSQSRQNCPGNALSKNKLISTLNSSSAVDSLTKEVERLSVLVDQLSFENLDLKRKNALSELELKEELSKENQLLTSANRQMQRNVSNLQQQVFDLEAEIAKLKESNNNSGSNNDLFSRIFGMFRGR